MSEFYDTGHRKLQDEFESRQLADRLQSIIVKDEIDDDAKTFIERVDFFFLSSVNDEGFPTTSYKGGPAGLVKVIDSKTLLFPCFDGNGMWLSAGNIDANRKVGLLFIDFENPGRLRLEGTAHLTRDAEETSYWPETALAVKVKVVRVWVNCPRYIHKMSRVEESPYVPREGVKTPVPEWKSMDLFADVTPRPPHLVNPKN